MVSSIINAAHYGSPLSGDRAFLNDSGGAGSRAEGDLVHRQWCATVAQPLARMLALAGLRRTLIQTPGSSLAGGSLGVIRKGFHSSLVVLVLCQRSFYPSRRPLVSEQLEPHRDFAIKFLSISVNGH